MWYMCYIWQEQSWELTLEVTTSQTALSQRRDNTPYGGGDVQSDHDHDNYDNSHDHDIGHDDYVWEKRVTQPHSWFSKKVAASVSEDLEAEKPKIFRVATFYEQKLSGRSARNRFSRQA